jgi:hypothetical protein
MSWFLSAGAGMFFVGIGLRMISTWRLLQEAPSQQYTQQQVQAAAAAAAALRQGRQQRSGSSCAHQRLPSVLHKLVCTMMACRTALAFLQAVH